MPNFSFLAFLEVAKKFVRGGGGVGGVHVTTMSNSYASCFRVVLSGVELCWVLTIFERTYSKAFPCPLPEQGSELVGEQDHQLSHGRYQLGSNQGDYQSNAYRDIQT